MVSIILCFFTHREVNEATDLCFAPHYLCIHFFHPEIKNFPSPSVHQRAPPYHVLSNLLCSQDSLQSLSCKQQSPLSSQALQLLQTQLYQDEKHLLCFHSFLEQLMPTRQAVQWEVERRGRKRMWAGSEIKSPFMFVKEEERAVIITLEALDCNSSLLCVNLCIHQVFAGGLEKNHTLPASICLRTQQTN